MEDVVIIIKMWSEHIFLIKFISTCEIALRWMEQNTLEQNIGSGNGLVPWGKTPWLEPMLTQIYVTIWHQQAKLVYEPGAKLIKVPSHHDLFKWKWNIEMYLNDTQYVNIISNMCKIQQKSMEHLSILSSNSISTV